jgi:hypothetical protein
MKTKNKENSQAQNINSSVKVYNYYFHADEDFREDHDWGKTKYTSGNNTSGCDNTLKSASGDPP